MDQYKIRIFLISLPSFGQESWLCYLTNDEGKRSVLVFLNLKMCFFASLRDLESCCFSNWLFKKGILFSSRLLFWASLIMLFILKRRKNTEWKGLGAGSKKNKKKLKRRGALMSDSESLSLYKDFSALWPWEPSSSLVQPTPSCLVPLVPMR